MDNFKNALPETDYAFEKVQKYKIPVGFNEFNKALKKLNE